MRFFRKVMKIGFVLVFSFESGATSYMVKAPQTPFSEFLSYLQLEQALPYAQEQEELLRKNLRFEKEKIMNLLEQSQESFLKDHLKNSSESFALITQKAYEKDWDEETREIIFYSFLRLAQIESKGEFSESFLHSAIIFAPDLEPNEEIFPPPFVEKFHQIKTDLPLAKLRFKKIFSNYETVFVNGKKVNLDQELKLPYGKYRVTALSSSHKPWSQIISLSDLIFQKKIITVSWVQGGCRFPEVSKEIKNYEILFPDSCVWKTSPERTEKLQSLTSEEVLKEDLNSLVDFKKKSTWFWIGGGVGLALMTLAIVRFQGSTPSSSSPNSPSSPTQTVGF